MFCVLLLSRIASTILALWSGLSWFKNIFIPLPKSKNSTEILYFLPYCLALYQWGLTHPVHSLSSSVICLPSWSTIRRCWQKTGVWREREREAIVFVPLLLYVDAVFGSGSVSTMILAPGQQPMMLDSIGWSLLLGSYNPLWYIGQCPLPKCFQVLISGICEYVTVHRKLNFADIIMLRILQWEDHLGLFGWDQYNHKSRRNLIIHWAYGEWNYNISKLVV